MKWWKLYKNTYQNRPKTFEWMSNSKMHTTLVKDSRTNIDQSIPIKFIESIQVLLKKSTKLTRNAKRSLEFKIMKKIKGALKFFHQYVKINWNTKMIFLNWPIKILIQLKTTWKRQLFSILFFCVYQRRSHKFWNRLQTAIPTQQTPNN